jgi:predicted MFS family arabinose efflux permease
VDQRALVPVLAVTQTVGYGVLYYAFSVLVTPVAAELGVPIATVTGALTVSVLVAAAAAVPVGRWLDGHGGRALMTAGSAVGVAGVLAWSQAREVWQLYAAFIAIGLASASSLYEAAFAVVIAASEPARRTNAVLAITVVAGFASTIFFPVTGLLLERLGWRHTLLVLAVVLAVIAIPAHAAALPRRTGERGARRTGAPHGRLRQLVRLRHFWALTAAFVAHMASGAAIGVLLVSYLIRAGHAATTAATLAGLLGVLSVTGRLVTTAAARRFGMTTVVAAVFAVEALGVLALPWTGGSVAGAAACIGAFGLGFGVASIARPAIVAHLYGADRYASIAGAMAAPIMATGALAPLVAAALPPDVFVTAAGTACLLSAGLLWRVRNAPPSG